MAAPLVAGEAALIRAKFPYLLNKDIARHLIEKSVNTGGDVRYRIDAGRALTTTPSGGSSSTPTPSPSPTPKGDRRGR